jgi:hypothetical protein
MFSRIMLRKPTLAQTWNHARRDRETGIPTYDGTLTQHPTYEEVETWAILAGYDPIHYATAWTHLRDDTRDPERHESTGHNEGTGSSCPDR